MWGKIERITEAVLVGFSTVMVAYMFLVEVIT